MDFQTLYGFFFGFQVIAKFSIKSKQGSGCYKKLTFADRYIIFRIEKTKMECNGGNFYDREGKNVKTDVI